jgi:TRAP-type C4-dicarboxylate transport system substrate-binding protein
MKKAFAITLLSGTAALMLAGPASAAEKWMFDIWLPLKHPIKTGYQDKFVKDVARVTNGRVTIEYPASRLAPGGKQWESVDKGIADVATFYTGWHRNRVRLPALAHLPFMVPNAEKASVAIWRTYKKMFASKQEMKSLKVLAFVTHNGSQIANSKHPISSVADLKGMKIRSSAGEAKLSLELMGANPVVTSGAKIFEYVSKGVVDGLQDGMHAPLAFKITRYLKYVTNIPGSMGTITFPIAVGMKKWNGLSKADQAAIEAVTGDELSGAGGIAFDKFTAKSVALMKKDGVKFQDAPPAMVANMKKLLASMRETYVKAAATRGVDGNAAIKYYRSQAFN